MAQWNLSKKSRSINTDYLCNQTLSESIFERQSVSKSIIPILTVIRCFLKSDFNVIHNALVESLFLKLYKLYDWNTASLTIRTLLKEMQSLEEEDLDVDVLKKYRENNGKFQHRLSVDEECFLRDDVEETKELCRTVGVEYTYTTKDISLQEIVQLYNKRFEKIPEYINIRDWRATLNLVKKGIDFRRMENESGHGQTRK